MSYRQKALSRAAATAVAGLSSLFAGARAAQAQLRIVQYNTGELKTGQIDVLQGIGQEQVNGIAKPLDILVTEEIGSTTTAEATSALGTIVNALNGIYGAGAYAAAPYSGLGNTGGTPTSVGGGGFPGVIYRTSTVSVVGLQVFGFVDATANTQSDLRYQIHPAGYDNAADFYLYASHFKASDGTTEANRRKAEVNSILANSNALGNVHAIYAGDYNFYRSGESGYATFTGAIAGSAQAIDPLGTANWEPSSPGAVTTAQKAKHTQSPTTVAHYGGQITGGMDDRFDFQLSTSEVNDGLGFAIIPGSYRAFGNNGSHVYQGDINVSNTWAPTGIANPQAVLDALNIGSDHIPVVADYQIPAKMTVSVTPSVPAKIITGTAVSLTAAVSNTAPVVASNGAEALTYSGTISGDVSGSVSGTRPAQVTPTPNNHTLTLSTATTGNKSGNIAISTANQGAAGASYNQGVSYQVVDHSNASFNSSTDVNAQSLAFGYVPQGFATRIGNFSIAALNPTPGFTARLDLDSITNTGDTSALSTNVTTFTNRNAGSSTGYTATLLTGTAGVFATTHTFAVSDEDSVTGGTAGTSLVLSTSARVISSATFPVSDFIQLNTGETYNTGAFAIQSGVTLTKTGTGTLNINAAQSNGSNSALVASAGVVTVGSDAGTNLALTANPTSTVNVNAIQHLRALNVAGGQVNAAANIVTDQFTHTAGKLDLKSNKLIVHNGNTAAIRTNVATGRNGGAWNGSGIITSESNAALATQITTLAVAAASDVLGISGATTTTWAGETVGAADTLVKYTWNGDANLSGLVDADDYFQIDAHYGEASASFVNGDFDYDGDVDSDDYAMIDLGYSGQSGIIGGSGVTSVPEPVFGSVFALALLGLRRSRKPTPLRWDPGQSPGL